MHMRRVIVAILAQGYFCVNNLFKGYLLHPIILCLCPSRNVASYQSMAYYTLCCRSRQYVLHWCSLCSGPHDGNDSIEVPYFQSIGHGYEAEEDRGLLFLHFTYRCARPRRNIVSMWWAEFVPLHWCAERCRGGRYHLWVGLEVSVLDVPPMLNTSMGSTIAQHANGRNIVIVKSTVPVRTAVTLNRVFLAQSTRPRRLEVGAGRAAEFKCIDGKNDRSTCQWRVHRH